jgi:hypothetical protein
LLERELGVPVGIFGVSGYAPQQYALAIERFALPRRPRIVVVGLFEGNDLDDAGRFESFRNSGLSWNQFEAVERASRLPTVRSPRYRRSLFGTLLWKSALDLLAAAGFERDPIPFAHEARPELVRAVISGNQIEIGFAGELLSRASRGEAEVRSLRGFDLTLQALRQARDRSRAMGAKLVVALFPSGESIYPAVLQSVIDEKKFSGLAAAGQSPRSRVEWQAYLRNRHVTDYVLTQALDRDGIPVVSLFDAMEASALAGIQLFNRDDSHWNATGHALAGRLIAEYLKASGLVP